MKNMLYKRSLIIGIVLLFIGAGVIPSVSVSSKKLTDVKSVQENVEKTRMTLGYSQPDLLVLLSNGTWMGNTIYETPSPTIQNYPILFHFGCIYLSLIKIENDGPNWLYNSTIQTTKLSTSVWTSTSSRLYYPKEGLGTGLAPMKLTDGPFRMTEFYPGQSVTMLLIIIKFPWSAQVQEQIDVFSPNTPSQERDTIILHT